MYKTTIVVDLFFEDQRDTGSRFLNFLIYLIEKTMITNFSIIKSEGIPAM